MSLAQWERLFGGTFTGLFVFAYNILGDRAPLAYEQLFTFRERLYGFVAVRLMDYAGHARPISPKWDTLAMPAAAFRRHARPLDEMLGLAERRLTTMVSHGWNTDCEASGLSDYLLVRV